MQELSRYFKINLIFQVFKSNRSGKVLCFLIWHHWKLKRHPCRKMYSKYGWWWWWCGIWIRLWNKAINQKMMYIWCILKQVNSLCILRFILIKNIYHNKIIIYVVKYTVIMQLLAQIVTISLILTFCINYEHLLCPILSASVNDYAVKTNGMDTDGRCSNTFTNRDIHQFGGQIMFVTSAPPLTVRDWLSRHMNVHCDGSSV